MADDAVTESEARRTLVVANSAGSAAELLSLLAKDVELVAASEPLATSVAALALPRYALLAFGAASEAALHCGAESGEALARLVLIAPEAIGSAEDAERLAPVLARIAAPVLVAFGTEDARSALGRHYRAGIRRCHFSLVYGAGADLTAERPAALGALVADFLRRGMRFVAPDESLALQP